MTSTYPPSPLQVAKTFNELWLADEHNGRVLLRDLWHDQPILIFLMRHLGCGLCRRELLRLRDNAAAFAAAKCAIIVVVMGEGILAAAFRDLYRLPFPVYGDPNQALYSFFDFGEASWWDVVGPHILVQQAGVLLKTGIPSALGPGSIRQLGGVVVLDADANIILRHVANPIYRYPTWDGVLQAIQQPSLTSADSISSTFSDTA